MQTIDRSLVDRIGLSTKAHEYELTAQAYRCLAKALHEGGQVGLSIEYDEKAALNVKLAQNARNIIRRKFK